MPATTATGERAAHAGIGERIKDNLKDYSARLKGFYGDVRSEMKRVTHPTMKDVVSLTTVVLVTVAMFGIFFFVVDAVFSRVVDTVIRYFSGV